MPDLKVDEIVTLKHKRGFIQYGGPRPNNRVQYAGQDAQYMSIEGVSSPEIGGIDPIRVHDLTRIGKYRLIGRSTNAPDLPTASLVMREKHNAIPRQLLSNCTFNVYETAGLCKNPADFIAGWSDYVMVYSGAIVTDKDLGNRTSFDSDEPMEDTLSITLSSIYPVGSLSFGEGASSQIDREVIDIVYGPAKDCVSCDFGNQRIYSVTKPSGAGSPGLPAEVIYTVDSGANWLEAAINSIGATEETYAIEVMGNYLVVIGADAYHYSEINSVTGVPGTFYKVSYGFVAAKSPRDIYVAGPREAYLVGLGGYIYKLVDVPTGVTVLNAGSATTSDLARIAGLEDTLVAVGANGAIVKSLNRGITWATTTTSPDGTLTVQAIAVLDTQRFWVGSSFPGRVDYTLDGGETWARYNISDASAIHDIYFATQEVGYIAYTTTSAAGKLLCTWNGGADWTRAAQRIVNWPTIDRANRIATPSTDDAGWTSNAIAVAGLAGDGVDGVALIGVANIN